MLNAFATDPFLGHASAELCHSMKLTARETDMVEQSSRTITRMTRRTALPLLCLHALTHFAAAQSVLTFAGNAQHTGIYQPEARNLNRILWSTSIDLNNTGAYAHYGVSSNQRIEYRGRPREDGRERVSD